MGLLDQVIGQVIGQMAGGAHAAPPAPRPSGLPPGGGASTAPGQPGGGLGDLLGGAAGKYSPLVLALLALLASKHLKSGAGGFGSILHDIFGRITGQNPSGRREAPGEKDALGERGYRPDEPPYGGPDEDPDGPGYEDEEPEDEEPPARRRGRPSSPGGFLNDIGSMLDGPGGRSPQGAPRRATRSEAGSGDFDDLVESGLEGLLDRFKRNGQGDAMSSWIGGGGNQPIEPRSLEHALGPAVVDELARRTGTRREDLLSQLSQALPQAVDKLTPHGRLPDPDEQARWV